MHAAVNRIHPAAASSHAPSEPLGSAPAARFDAVRPTFLHRVWLFPVLALVGCGIVGACTALGITSSLWLTSLSLAMTLYSLRTRVFEQLRRVRVEAGVLRVGDRVLGRAASYSARIVPELPTGLGFGPARPRTRVELVDDEQRPVLEMEAASHEEAHAFLAALGADRGTGEFLGVGRAYTSRWGIVGLCVVTVLACAAMVLGGWLGAVSVPVVLGLAALGGAPLRVRVGADGVALRRLGTRTFVQFSDVREIIPTEQGATLIRASKPPITIDIAGRGIGVRATSEVQAFQRYLAYAFDRWCGLGRSGASALLAQNGRSLDTWRRDLDALARGDGYREAGLTDELLWGVVEDATADSTARAGAAHLLRDRLDATGRGRLHECIRVTAAPKLRVALEECASAGDDHEATDRRVALHTVRLSRA